MYEADFQNWESLQNDEHAFHMNSRIDEGGNDREMDHMANVDVC